MDTLALAPVDNSDFSTAITGDLSLQDKKNYCAKLEGQLCSRCDELLETHWYSNYVDRDVGRDKPETLRKCIEIMGESFAFMQCTV